MAAANFLIAWTVRNRYASFYCVLLARHKGLPSYAARVYALVGV